MPIFLVLAIGLVMPVVNTETILLHLEHISLKIPKGKRAVIVLDKAAGHTTKRLKQFRNTSLLPLPPTSPKLNPTEQAWQALRDKYLANRCMRITMALSPLTVMHGMHLLISQTK